MLPYDILKRPSMARLKIENSYLERLLDRRNEIAYLKCTDWVLTIFYICVNRRTHTHPEQSPAPLFAPAYTKGTYLLPSGAVPKAGFPGPAAAASPGSSLETHALAPSNRPMESETPVF